MEQITIRIRNRDKADLLLALLHSLDFVESIETEENGVQNDSNASVTVDQQGEFWAMAGLWADRDITQESLRQQAWPSQQK